MKVDIYIASDDAKPGRADRWIGYLIKAEEGKGYVIRADLLEATSYRAILIAMVAALDRFVRPADITFHLEREWVIGKLIRPVEDGKEKPSVLEGWQENGWKTKRKTTVENKDAWQRLYNKLRVFEHSGAVFSYNKLGKDDPNRDRILFEIERQRKEV